MIGRVEKRRVAFVSVEERGNRRDAEVARIAKVRSNAAVPIEVSDQIIAAPGRGTFAIHRPREATLGEAGPVLMPQTRQGFHAIIVASPLRALEAASARARGKDAQPLFTEAQHETATRYQALAEVVAKGGVKCSSLDGGGIGGRSTSAMDSIFGSIQAMRFVRKAVGLGAALEPSGQRAHMDRGRRRISDMAALEMVCARGIALADVLKRFGWSAKHLHRKALLDSLRRSLDAAYDIL